LTLLLPSRDGPGRLWSLWDLMNQFKAWPLVWATAKFVVYQRTFIGPAVLPLTHETVLNFLTALGKAERAFRASGIKDGANRMKAISTHITGTSLHVAAALGAEARHARTEIGNQLRKRKFLRIEETRAEFLDKDDLFGEAVSANFQSAARDIREAGNCLAAECGTASVFHLMRAAEFGLRALAKDRRVQFADKPLEHKEWGQILPNLEGKVREWKDGTIPGSRWADPFVREKQIQFYHEVIQELRSFNEAWRSHVSHADALAFYDSDQATGVMTHVRTFMNKLATKISETSTTPEIWTSA
jgi:hypothetical protein